MEYLLRAIIYSLYFVEMILFLRVIMSWFRLSSDNKFVNILYKLTEPILAPIRLLISKSIFGGRKGGMILDISPLIAFIFIQLIQNYIMQFITYGY